MIQGDQESASTNRATGNSPTAASHPLDSLDAAIVADDEATRRLYAEDIFTLEPVLPAAVIRPRNHDEVQTAVAALAAAGASFRVRGGGMSYTGGYVPETTSDYVIDTSALDEIIQIDPENRFIVVGAGCTWGALLRTLEPLGMEPAINPPVSGSHATVGGGVSQGLPGEMNGVLSVTAVTPAGHTITTGSAGTTAGALPFCRHHGADLTGLFIGDCARYGVKTRIVLRLRNVGVTRCASFLFENIGELIAASAEIGSSGLARRCMGLDPGKTREAKPATISEAASYAVAMVRRNGLVSTLRAGIGGLTAGSSFGWTLHVTCEGATALIADENLRLVRGVCRLATREIEPSVPLALQAKPFNIRGMAGRDGEAWVPVHGILAPTRARRAGEAIAELLASRKDGLDEHAVRTGMLVSAGMGYVLLEPMFMWPDQLAPVVRANLRASTLARFPERDRNAAARRFVQAMREEVRDLLSEHDATFLQVGNFYPDPLAGTRIPEA